MLDSSLGGVSMLAPHRRHRFMLNLEADSLEALVGALHFLADQIEAEGDESLRMNHRGRATAYQARLRTDPQQDAGRYREQVASWCRGQQRPPALPGVYDPVG
jgi:hypothetical protein